MNRVSGKREKTPSRALVICNSSLLFSAHCSLTARSLLTAYRSRPCSAVIRAVQAGVPAQAAGTMTRGFTPARRARRASRWSSNVKNSSQCDLGLARTRSGRRHGNRRPQAEPSGAAREFPVIKCVAFAQQFYGNKEKNSRFCCGSAMLFGRITPTPKLSIGRGVHWGLTKEIRLRYPQR